MDMITCTTAIIMAIVIASHPASAVESAEFVTETENRENHGRNDYETAIRLIREGRNSEALPLLARAMEKTPDDLRLQGDYLLCLIWTGAHPQAVEFYQSREASLRSIPYLPRNVARAYFELRNYPKALELYLLGWSIDRKDEESFKGVVFSLLRMGNAEAALEASAEWSAANSELSADTVGTVKSVVFEHLGASHSALEIASGGVKISPSRRESLKNDIAVMKLRWNESTEAVADLESILAANPANLRARGDYVVALTKVDRMAEALDQVKIYRQSSPDLPEWVSRAAGNAALHLKRPEEAERYYNISLDKEPSSIPSLMGLFYAYSDMRDWKAASLTLDRLERLLTENRLVQEESDLIDARGWLLLYREKLEEGERYFDHYLARAGGNSGLRSGLAHDYAWSNRPRLAREQFDIIRHNAPYDYHSLTGLAWTLNDLNLKNESRELAAEIYRMQPTKPFIEDLRRSHMAEEMWRLQPEFSYVTEFGDGSEYLASLTLEKPVVPTFSLFTQILRQETQAGSGSEHNRDYWNRVGIGFRWIIIPEIILTQSVSADYLDQYDFGSDTRLFWWPNDPLRINAEYNSFSLDIPLRARVQGISGQQANLDATYLDRDVHEYGATVGTLWFSDNNRYLNGALRYNGKLHAADETKLWGGAELWAGSYTKQDVDYFSPAFEWTALITTRIERIHLLRYERKWLSAIQLRGGIHGQLHYGVLPMAGVTLEQQYTHSKTVSMRGSVSYDLKSYDGRFSNALGTYLNIDWRF